MPDPSERDCGARSPEDLLPLVYDELRRRAARAMRSLPPGQTLQPTALVHEAYARLASGEQSQRPWRSEQHFLAVATHALRSLIVDRIRAKKRLKRGGDRSIGALHDDIPIATPPFPDDTVLAIDAALDHLRQSDARAAEVVILRVHMDLKEEEIASVLGVSDRTVRRDWTFARTWLMKELQDSGVNLRVLP